MPTTDFSYDRDVAPHLSRFFGRVAADPRLSPESQLRLQTEVLSGVNAIEDQRLKLQQQRDQGVLARQRMEMGLLQMDDTRRQIREREARAAKAAQASTEIRSVLGDSTLTPTQKKQRLAESAVGYMTDADTNVRDQFGVAMKALPEDEEEQFTPSQLIEMGASNVPPEVIASGDPTLIGRYMGQAAEAAREQKLKERVMLKQLEGDEQERKRVLTAPMRYADPDDEGRVYLKDESQVAAKLLVQKYGTPEEREAFAAQQDDRERARIAMEIQIRNLSAGGQPDKRTAVKSRLGL